MTEQLISFKTAKLAKEKGFTIPNTAFDYYKSEKVKSRCHRDSKTGNYCLNFPQSNYCIIVTQSLLQKWLREKHEIFVIILPQTSKFGLKWTTNFHNRERTIQCWKTYEEAFEVGLQEGLKLMK